MCDVGLAVGLEMIRRRLDEHILLHDRSQLCHKYFQSGGTVLISHGVDTVKAIETLTPMVLNNSCNNFIKSSGNPRSDPK